MEINRLSDKKNLFILGIIVAFALFGLWLRLLPMPQLMDGPVQKLIFMDTWYNMRMIEQITANFPHIPWFDPMNGYPVGKEIDWGPLFPLICSIASIIAGAATRPAMMTVSSWVPPLLSLLMIPLMYTVGTYAWDKRAGIVSALLISIISGEYMYRSLFGYVDHHILETILSTAFMVCYILMIHALMNQKEIVYSKKSILFAVLAGLLYFLGIMNIPTMVMFAMIVAIFLLIHAVIIRDADNLKALTIHHGVIFGIFIVLFALFGIHQSGWNLTQYTPTHIVLAFILIAEPAVLYVLVHYLKNRPSWQYAASILGTGLVLYGIISLILPTITTRMTDAFTGFFFASYAQTFINEMQMWDLTRAFHSFNIAFILMAVGFLFCGYRIVKKYDPIRLVVLIWGLVVLISTFLHLRYEYYFAANVVLFAAIGIIALSDLLPDSFSRKKPIQKGKKTHDEKRSSLITPGLVLTAALILIITALSANISWVVANDQIKIVSMDNDWAGALLWLPEHSPDPGMDYLKIYNEEGFSYPSQSYGVLSWWDYGHWIEFLSKRMPISTPFQNNVEPVARFLTATDEATATKNANEVGARYIITDYQTATTKFAALPLWAAGQDAISTYQTTYYQKSNTDSSRFDPILTLKPAYFDTMIAKLHMFDGSAVQGDGGHQIEYAKNSIGGQTIPVISKTVQVNSDKASQVLTQGLKPGQDMVSVVYTNPILNITALTQYRLIYESPTVIAKDGSREIRSVKIFERVKGHVIPGAGIIELPIITNQGRSFVYRQNSVNGQFVVPYSTSGNLYDVKATGPYTIVGSGQTFNVTEDQIN